MRHVRITRLPAPVHARRASRCIAVCFLKGPRGVGRGGGDEFHAGCFTNPALRAGRADGRRRKCILLWLCGAPSQFETWDPKPGRPTGGPFGSIPTTIPGVHFSSLMPHCAGIARPAEHRAQHEDDADRASAGASICCTRGNPDRAGFTRPDARRVGLRGARAVSTRRSRISSCSIRIPDGNEFKEFKASELGGLARAGARAGAARRQLHAARPRRRCARGRPRGARGAAPLLRRRNTSTTARAAPPQRRTPPSSG